MTYRPKPVPVMAPEVEASPLITDEYTVVHALPDMVTQRILAVSETDWAYIMEQRSAEERQSWR